MIGVVVVGSGFGRRVVAPVFDSTDGCTVVDVVSARDDAEVRRAVARPEVDLVAVHSPPFLHAPHVRVALDAGKAVLCDKPFALDADEAADLERQAIDADVVALCNFEFRYEPARELLRERILDGSLGPVEHVRWIHHSAGSRVPLRPWGWLFDASAGGGWIGAWGSHAIDTIRWLFGEVAETRAVRRIDVAERPDRTGEMHACTAEDGFTASLVLASGATVALDSGFAAVATTAPRLTVFGSAAVVELVADEQIATRYGDGRRDTITLDGVEGDRHLEPMRRWAEVVRDAVRTGDIPSHAPTFADGRACDEVLDALRAAPLALDLAPGIDAG